MATLEKLDNAVTDIHAHGLEEASRQLAPFLQVRYLQLQRGGACFHGTVARLENTFVGRAGADRDKVECIEVPRGRTLIVIPTAGVARLGTMDVTTGHAMVAHGPTQLIAYTDREYRMLFALMPGRWSDPGVTLLRISETETRVFYRYIHRGLRQASRERGTFSRVTTLPALDAPLVNLCDSWLRERAIREPDAGTNLARCQAAIRARQYIDEHLDEPLTLAGVCSASYSSPRALEYGFREIFGVSPITYIRCARLSRVRRELYLSTHVQGRVTQLAMKWGFWHLSQFSSDYYELFGELPSTTLGRAAGRLTRSVTQPCNAASMAATI